MILLLLLAAAGAGLLLARLLLRRRGLDGWLYGYVRETSRRRAPARNQPVHLLLCIADHFEPNLDGASANLARARCRYWVEEFPRRLGHFRDSDGFPPRHTFFYPMEAYAAEHVDALAELCRAGFAEVEIHLHHDHDSSAEVRQRLNSFKRILAYRHGLLSRQRGTGRLAYGFIHGNWALDNSRPDGRWCGVNDELDVLRETGCYADFTLPSAPSPTQTRKINSIYYAWDDPMRPRSHDTGRDAGLGPTPTDALLLIQGPLLLDWQRRKWGILPRIENACLQASQPPSRERLDLWLRASVQVAGRPDWYFVKLHTHGAKEENRAVLLGEPMLRLHQELTRRARDNPLFRFHYVTAREMFNLVRAAESGYSGSVADARDFQLLWNGRRLSKSLHTASI
jgi:hypothetical protein